MATTVETAGPGFEIVEILSGDVEEYGVNAPGWYALACDGGIPTGESFGPFETSGEAEAAGLRSLETE